MKPNRLIVFALLFLLLISFTAATKKATTKKAASIPEGNLVLNDCSTLKANGTWSGSGGTRVAADGMVKITLTDPMDASSAARLSWFKPSSFTGYKGLGIKLDIKNTDPSVKGIYEFTLYGDSVEKKKYKRKLGDTMLINSGASEIEYIFDYSFDEADNPAKPLKSGDKIDSLHFVFNGLAGVGTSEIEFDQLTLLNAKPTPVPAATPMADKKICGKILMACYPYWTTYRAKQLPFEKLTHIYHAFLKPADDGSLMMADVYTSENIPALAHPYGVKVIAAIGGASKEADASFKAISKNEKAIAKFASEIANFCVKYKYDGVDIDWEFPTSLDDKKGFTKIIKAIRAEFDKKAPGLIIGIAAPTDRYYGTYIDYEAITPYLTFVNLMTYDYHGPWSNHTGHNAPLLADSDNADQGSVSKSVDYLVTVRKVPPEKINMGLAFYGRNFSTSKQLYTICGGQCPATDMRYYEIADLVNNGWKYNWDKEAQVPYLTKGAGDGLIVYDDPTSIGIKVDYALKTRGLNGTFMWEITQDFKDGKQPLLDAMYDATTGNCK